MEVEELYGLDPGLFEPLKPVHGLVFLFKWVAGQEPAGPVLSDSRKDAIFFAQQASPPLPLSLSHALMPPYAPSR